MSPPPTPSPPLSSLLSTGRQGGWLCTSSSDLRCSPGLVMAGQPAVDHLRVLFPGRPDRLPPLLFLLSPGFPRMGLPVVTLLPVVPVLRSMRRMLRTPLFPLSVLPHRAAAPLFVIPSDALFAPLCLYPPFCGSWASVIRATYASTACAARRPLASPPGCGGAGPIVRRAASVAAGGRRAALVDAGSREAAGACRHTIVAATPAVAIGGHRASIGGCCCCRCCCDR
jgi:hypothetical protein